jgi:hypothetical protein
MPVHVPVTGHNLILDVAAERRGDIALRGLWAQVIGREPLRADGISMALRRKPDLDLTGPDHQESSRLAMQNFEELEIPQYEVVLDVMPALVRPAMDQFGRRVRAAPGLPLPIPSGGRVRLVLAVVTADPNLVRWRLLADITHAGQVWPVTWDLTVTARSGITTDGPGWERPQATPIHEMFPNHWALRYHSGLSAAEPAATRVRSDANAPVRLETVSQIGRITPTEADGALTVIIDECEVPDRAAGWPRLPAGRRLWVCTSDGLKNVGLTEVTAAVTQPADGSDGQLSLTLPGLMTTLYQQARDRGVTIRPGMTIAFDVPLTVNGGPVGGYIVKNPAADGAWYPANSPPLLLIPLHDEEFRAVLKFGEGRVLAQLAAQQACFPYPWWFDPLRRPVLDFDTYAAATILADVPIVHLPFLQFMHAGRRLAILLDSQDCWHALREVWEDAPRVFALAPRYTTATGRARMWSPGQAETREICTPDGASPNAGIHFLLITRDAQEATAAPVEDGFALSIPTRDWAYLATRIRTGTPVTWTARTHEVTIAQG